MKLWIAGLYRAKVETTDAQLFTAWEFVGLFDSEEKAVAVCRTRNHFVVPVKLNKDTGDPTTNWQGLYYPKAAR